jgi:hypothetical protein
MSDANSALLLSPGDAAHPLRLRARIHLANGDLDAALKDISGSLTLDAGDAESHLVHSQIQKELDEREAAAQRVRDHEARLAARADTERRLAEERQARIDEAMQRRRAREAEQRQRATNNNGGRAPSSAPRNPLGGFHTAFESAFRQSSAASFDASFDGPRSPLSPTASSAPPAPQPPPPPPPPPQPQPQQRGPRYAPAVLAAYASLQLPLGAAADQMKRRQRELALKWHPDRWSSGTAEERALAESRMKEINAAFGTLEEAAAVAAAASV